MSTELQKIIINEIKKGMLTILHQIDNINKKDKNYKKESNKIMELKVKI